MAQADADDCAALALGGGLVASHRIRTPNRSKGDPALIHPRGSLQRLVGDIIGEDLCFAVESVVAHVVGPFVRGAAPLRRVLPQWVQSTALYPGRIVVLITNARMPEIMNCAAAANFTHLREGSIGPLPRARRRQQCIATQRGNRHAVIVSVAPKPADCRVGRHSGHGAE